MSKQQNVEVKFLTYFSKYPMNKVSDTGKDILYKGLIKDIPDNLKDKVEIGETKQKFILIYTDK